MVIYQDSQMKPNKKVAPPSPESEEEDEITGLKPCATKKTFLGISPNSSHTNLNFLTVQSMKIGDGSVITNTRRTSKVLDQTNLKSSKQSKDDSEIMSANSKTYIH
jgi:hypothetical protein